MVTLEIEGWLAGSRPATDAEITAHRGLFVNGLLRMSFETVDGAAAAVRTAFDGVPVWPSLIAIDADTGDELAVITPYEIKHHAHQEAR